MLRSLLELNDGEGPIGGKTPAEIAASVALTAAAVSTNTAGAIVKRDGSGNFAAGTITAALAGNATSATTSVDGAAAKVQTDAATTSPTASTIVRRSAAGYIKDRADSSEIMMPGYRKLIAELGYTDIDGLWRMQELSGGLVSRSKAADPTLSVLNTPTYGRMSNGFQGIYLDTDGDVFGFQQDVLDFGTGSVHLAVAFERVSDTGAIQSLIGRYAATRYLQLQIGSSDTAQAIISDGTRSTSNTLSATTLAVGGIYLAQLHLRKDDGTLTTRLSRWGTGLVSAEVSTDVLLYTTLSGGTTPGFSIGAGANWGTGVNFLGAFVRRGTECNVAGRMAAAAALLGFE